MQKSRKNEIIIKEKNVCKNVEGYNISLVKCISLYTVMESSVCAFCVQKTACLLFVQYFIGKDKGIDKTLCCAVCMKKREKQRKRRKKHHRIMGI